MDKVLELIHQACFIVIKELSNTTAGGSVLQSPLIMPMLQQSNTPVQHAANLTAYLLHNSEYFFPPLNLLCTVSNLALTGLAYYYSRAGASTTPSGAATAAAKLPFVATAFALNMATTAWAIGIMVPMNKRMAKNAEKIDKAEKEGARKTVAISGQENEFRGLQRRWQTLNYGRAAIMIASSIVSINGLLKTV